MAVIMGEGICLALGRAHEQIIQPLERFRKEHIGAVKEGKKKFDKKTAKFCQSQERTLSLSTKKPETVFQEADAAMDMAERDFCQASLEYVFQLQAVQERKKFELVETLLGFVFGWWTFHHTAHDVHADAEPLVRDLQLRIQRTRSNFEETSKQTESLMKKMMEVRQMNKEEGVSEDPGGVSRAGYLFLMEKKAFGTAWSKHYCTYEKQSHMLSLMPYNQINVKTTGPVESVCVCGARAACEAERRFCWEAVPGERERPPLTLQALSERDRAAWLRALDAAPAPLHALATPAACKGEGEPQCELNEAGFAFVRRVIAILEARGLEEQGLYRVAGVASKVARVVGAAAGQGGGGELAEPCECESKTLTSALKSYLRALPEPLLTRRLHDQFLAAAKRERREDRVAALHALLLLLPHDNRRMLRLVLRHLRNVAAKCDKNLMTTSNLAVCFGPTLLRPERETVASILELKFCNVLVETLLEHFDAVFDPAPPTPAPAPVPPPVVAPPAPLPPPAAPPPHRAHNGLLRTSPTSLSAARNDMSSGAYAPHQQSLLQHFAHLQAPHAPQPAPLPVHLAHRGAAGRCSSSSESVSSHSASPPPPRYTRVRTLYACLGESEGELSFEPNQIITNVTPSGEPGWLRGSLDGRSGLVPENYVEPLP
ncbi:rho GTPase-activating protein 26 isoform X2 [Battus philenor]|uniref:rho GTPase-activating protein 26 isoform X2 n=1 Tax=Battus philenor TaxID=42288 RepID=UPI0035D12BF1